MRILVTGGAGFIGSHIVEQLVAHDHEVVVCDSLNPAAHRSRPDQLDPHVEYHWEDIKNVAAVSELVRTTDAVCHQAAMVGLGIDFSDVTEYVTENDLGTAVLLRSLHDTGWVGRIVLASSMVVYGEGLSRCPQHGVVRPPPRAPAALDHGAFEPECSECGRPLEPISVTEDTPVDPRNVYAATKLHQEHLCNAFAREHEGVTVAALRYHNVYGPRMPRNTPYAGVASIFRSAYERGDAPHVYEDGGQLRDFIHARDVARANVLALTCEQKVGGAFNIATGSPRTVLDMATQLGFAFETGRPVPKVTGEWRTGDVRHIFAAPDRAAELLNFRAEVTFDDGMREFATAELRP
jgi:dTDP-L-rhamnose 4-epimerase